MSLEIRPVESAGDLATGVDLYNRVIPERAQSEREVREYVALLPAHVHLLALAEGTPAGLGFVALEPGNRTQGLGSTILTVLHEARGRGVGSRLLDELGSRCRALGLETLEGWVEEEDGVSLAWGTRRGYTEVGRESKLFLDLTAVEASSVEPPQGIELTTLAERPELARGLYEVALEAYPDIPGNEEGEPTTFEEWAADDLHGPSDRPEAVFVALAGDEVVGYSKFHLPEARPTTAFHDLTGVKRAWRGRGIAGTLKGVQIAWAKNAGFERLETMNEVRNEPIRRLNARFGYREASGRVLLRGPLGPR